MAQARIFYQQDCDINVLKGKRVAIIGYGSQGHAHALNLKESGVDVVVGLYEGSKSWAKAEQQGLGQDVALHPLAAHGGKGVDRHVGHSSLSAHGKIDAVPGIPS